MALIVASLDKAAHDRAAFDCGEPALDNFLRTKAAQNHTRRVSRTFVLVNSAEPRRTLGYYSLNNAQVAREQLSDIEARALPRHPVPAVMLARLAVSRSQQGKRFGFIAVAGRPTAQYLPLETALMAVQAAQHG